MGAPAPIQGVLTSLAGLRLESASAVNPALVRLQMVRALAEAWQLRWPGLSLVPRGPVVSQAAGGAGGGAAPAVPEDEQWHAAERQWRAREAQSGTCAHRIDHARACQDADTLSPPRRCALKSLLPCKARTTLQATWVLTFALSGAGGRYELAEPLLALRGVLARALDRAELAVNVALEAARQARKAGDLPNAMSALHNIKRAAATCASTDVTQVEETSDVPCCVHVSVFDEAATDDV